MRFALETPRLSLRLRDHADAEWNLELLAEHDPPNVSFGVEEMRERLASQRVAAMSSGLGLLTVRRRADGAALGYCGLIVGRSTVDEPEIVYELLRRHHGHGYATEAARAVVSAAAETGRERVWATVRPWNAASLRVLDKVGFVRHHADVDGDGELVYLKRELS
ncbi:N-acetyltransferase [Jiangella ureilytica]|uniref:N-acetyltransferase n=1 Tax=Jiangella ureilytica TaxID=2530374 RepID=A0A4R4RLU3_9ACTN|nr:GNAT family N-acetyltransferase [Jiangella ureilytica]TDC49473.1 N-acetyltransferase [Jiangella ureilytica]